MGCNSKQRNLCKNNNCQICLDRSFASFKEKTDNGKLKIDCWDLQQNNGVRPRDVFIGSNKKYLFKHASLSKALMY